MLYFGYLNSIENRDTVKLRILQSVLSAIEKWTFFSVKYVFSRNTSSRLCWCAFFLLRPLFTAEVNHSSCNKDRKQPLRFAYFSFSKFHCILWLTISFTLKLQWIQFKESLNCSKFMLLYKSWFMIMSNDNLIEFGFKLH